MVHGSFIEERKSLGAIQNWQYSLQTNNLLEQLENHNKNDDKRNVWRGVVYQGLEIYTCSQKWSGS